MSKVAIIATGGTVAAVGADAFDVVNYDAGGKMLDVDELLARCRKGHTVRCCETLGVRGCT